MSHRVQRGQWSQQQGVEEGEGGFDRRCPFKALVRADSARCSDPYWTRIRKRCSCEFTVRERTTTTK